MSSALPSPCGTSSTAAMWINGAPSATRISLNVEQWCTEMDEDITQDEVDNEDDMDMTSERRRAPSFVSLKTNLMRPRTKSQVKRLKAKMEKVGFGVGAATHSDNEADDISTWRFSLIEKYFRISLSA